MRCVSCNEDYINNQESDNDEDCGDIPCRDYDNKFIISKYKNNLNTDIVQSKRGFGVEIEAYGQSYSSIEDIADQIDHKIGISGDGSLGNRGFELQFPLINGLQAEKLVKDTCKILSENTATVNSDCGYHIHLQCLPNEQSFVFIQRLMFVATIFDDVIMSFLPEARRRNRYCQSLRNYINLDEIARAKNKQDLELIWYKTYNKQNIRRRKNGKYDDSRYYGFNFHAYLSKMKHLEIRHHTGTLNADKMLHWANLHTLLLDAIHREIDIESDLTKWEFRDVMIKLFDSNFSRNPKLKEKTDFLFNFIGLSEKSKDHFIKRQNKFNN